MGGIIGLTIRFSDGEEYRGSCWTNVTPTGLFSHEFYDPKTSETHVRWWLKRILDNRKKDKEVEDIWGGWNMLAPVEYGLMLLDYKTKTMIAGNGYTDPCGIMAFPHNPAQVGKFIRLYEAGLLSNFRFEREDKPASEERVKEYVTNVSDYVVYDGNEWNYSFRQKKKPAPKKKRKVSFVSVRGENDFINKMPVISGQIKIWMDKVINFDSEPEKWREVKAWIDANFKLTEKEEKEWKEWMERYSEAEAK